LLLCLCSFFFMSLNDIFACVFCFSTSCPFHSPSFDHFQYSETFSWFCMFWLVLPNVPWNACSWNTHVLSTHCLDDTLKLSIHWCAAVVSSTWDLKSMKERIHFQVLFLVSVFFVCLLLCGFRIMSSEQNRVSYWMPSLHNDDWLLVWVISDCLLHMFNNLYAQPSTWIPPAI
jgi:hypothetical protein